MRSRDLPAVEPAVIPDAGVGFLLVVPVAEHHTVTTETNLAWSVHRDHAAVQVHDFGLVTSRESGGLEQIHGKRSVASHTA